MAQTVLKTPYSRVTSATPRYATRPMLPLMVGLFAVLIVSFVASIAVGSISIPLDDILTILLGGEPTRAAWTQIVINFRLPKALTAVLAGAALSVGGLMMQTLFRNPLTDPFALGISSGASLGVALIVLSAGVGSTLLAGFSLAGDLGLAIAASLGAAAVMLLVLFAARRVQHNYGLLILGLMFGYAFGALVSLLLYFSVAERIQAYVNWTFGSFGGVTWRQMSVFGPVVLVGLAMTLLLRKPLNALLLGEIYAQSMGINVQRVRFGIVVSTALLAGAVTAFCGPIAFLGLAVPHLARAIFRTADHQRLLPACAVLGAIVALTADLIAQLPGAGVILPLNAVMALIGAPVVIVIILRGRTTRAFER